jgi:hypothetical protein
MIISREENAKGHRQEIIHTYKIHIRKPVGKNPVGRSERKCNNNLKVNIRHILYEGMKWIAAYVACM